MTTAVILIHQPDGSVREHSLAAERHLIGRSPECAIVVEGKLISRQHAAIERVGQTYFLRDLGSQNGTQVNDRPVTGDVQLHNGDRISLGGMGKLVFFDNDSTSFLTQPASSGVWLDPEKQDVWIDGQCLDPKLSPAQYKLLETLAAKPDRICSRAEIIQAVWPDITEGVSDEAVDALIKRVRFRLGEIKNGDQYLVTYRSRGFMLKSAK